MTSRPLNAVWLSICLLFASSVASATGFMAERTLDVDLEQKIAASVAKRERFAVDVPHAASNFDVGNWERAAGMSIWRYAVRIPTAVSLSFHAASFKLPAGAALIVTAKDGSRAIYLPGDGGRGELWSRVQRGDALSFELHVPSGLESQVVFSLASLQAGYRGIGGGAPDHPYYRKLQQAQKMQAAAAGAPTCIENFACHATAQNAMNGDATAAIVIGGVSLCSATLINNLRNDGAPYLLSARHCQDTPSSGVVVYWDAVSPCGGVLGSVYDTQTPAYVHSTNTAFEQEDVWLIRLTGPINGARAFFAAWDVTGLPFSGGYTPHHTLGRSRQYTEWAGTSATVRLPGSTLGRGYDSTFWGVVNSVGSLGSGGSGSGLFTPGHRIAGVASLAYLQNGSGSDGVCPVTPAPVPDSTTSTVLFNSLAAVWNTNADTTSFTNPVTLKSLLDPDNTGLKVSGGFELLRDVYMSVNNEYGSTGTPVTITWTGGAATSCTGSGGSAGDGWAGSHPASGTFDVTQYEPGFTEYQLRCSDGARYASRSVRVGWIENAPTLFVSASSSSDYTGTTERMFWRSTVQPCMASGGSAGDGWAGPKAANGEQFVTLIQSGDVTYTMTCGSGARSITQSATVGSIAPVAVLEPKSNNMRIGSEVLVLQTAGGFACTRTGGAPGDGWTAVSGSYPIRLTSQTAGTFHYVLTCNGGTTPAVATMDLTFTNAAPFATLTSNKTSAEVAPVGPVGDITSNDNPRSIGFSWVSNVSGCQLTYDGPGSEDGAVNPQRDYPAVDTLYSYQSVTGSYVYRITCGSGASTATATATVGYGAPLPRVKLWLDSTYQRANHPFDLLLDHTVSPCVASGGAPGDGWAGTINGFTQVTEKEAGSYTYTITCGTAPDLVTDSITITLPALEVHFEPYDARVRVGSYVYLHWNGSAAPCVRSGDWSGTTAAEGIEIVSENTPGIRTYGIRCGTSTIVTASAQVEFRAIPVVDITANVTQVSVGQPVTLSWTSANSDSCGVGSSPAPDWSGPLPKSGSRVVTRNVPAYVAYYFECDQQSDYVVVHWQSVVASPETSAPPTVNLAIDHATRVTGEAVTLTWTSTKAAGCRGAGGAGGASGDGWISALPVSGSRSIVVNTAGTYDWEITCDGAPPSVTARVSATYTAATTPPPPPPAGSGGSGGSGGGGGGGLDAGLLAALSALTMWAASRRRRVWSAYTG